MATPDYNVDLEKNPELQAVRTEENNAITNSDATYDNMISQSDQFYNKQIQATQNWADKQTEIQNEQTDFAIEQIEQQKEQANKDYIKEQSGSYVDWQKQSNQYGVNAEQRAAGGMQNTGYTESAQVSMYNTYQNRVATAREVYARAVLNYDNAIKDARLQNNAALAQIAYESLQKQLELSLAGFQYKNQLIAEKADRQMQIKSLYQTKWATVLDQINTENAMAEDVRQYNESLAESIRHNQAVEKNAADSLALDKAKFAFQKAQALKPTSSSSSGGSSGGGSGSGSKGGSTINKGSTGKNNTVNISDKESDATSSNANNKGSTVDMDSVLALGYGPISAEKLSDLVKKGVIKKYEEDGKIKFYKSTGFAGAINTPNFKVNLK